MPAMTGIARYDLHGGFALIVRSCEILAVDVCRHTHHVAGNFLVLALIRGKVEPAFFGGRRGMAKAAAYTEGDGIFFHQIDEAVMPDVLWKHGEVGRAGRRLALPVFILRYCGCGHTGDKQEEHSGFG